MTVLATEGGHKIWRAGPPREAWPTLFAGAALAELVFSAAWFLQSAESAAEEIRRPGSNIDKPLNFFWGTLRVNTAKIGGVEPFSSKEESRNWFGCLMSPVEDAVAAWLPRPAAASEEPKPRKATIFTATDEQLREQSEVVRAAKAVLGKKRPEAPR